MTYRLGQQLGNYLLTRFLGKVASSKSILVSTLRLFGVIMCVQSTYTIMEPNRTKIQTFPIRERLASKRQRSS